MEKKIALIFKFYKKQIIGFLINRQPEFKYLLGFLIFTWLNRKSGNSKISRQQKLTVTNASLHQFLAYKTVLKIYSDCKQSTIFTFEFHWRYWVAFFLQNWNLSCVRDTHKICKKKMVVTMTLILQFHYSTKNLKYFDN